MTFSKMIFNIMTLSIMTLSIMTLSIMTLSIRTLSIPKPTAILSKNESQYNDLTIAGQLEIMSKNNFLTRPAIAAQWYSTRPLFLFKSSYRSEPMACTINM
jgi:hypothetical protein